MHAPFARPKQGYKETSGTHSESTRTRGVLLINLGTPDAPDTTSVRKYLAEFLGDPEVIRLPSGLGWFGRPLGRLIARFRASRSAEMYRMIWTDRGSPLVAISRDQAHALERVMPDGWRVFCAMRYGRPSIGEMLREIEASGVEELVVVPMYPQFSGPTTGTAMRELYTCMSSNGCAINARAHSMWYDDGGYIHAQARLIQDFAESKRLTPTDTHLLFSAHGLPVSYVERGDPYPRHIERSVQLVVEHLGWPADRSSLAFQSRFGPSKWLTPGTNDVLRELASAGERNILVCPISFVTDCLETLEEIGIRYAQIVKPHGGTLHLCPALNTFEPFIDALRSIVLKGPNPIMSWGPQARPLLSRAAQEPVRVAIENLVMIGTSLKGRIGPGEGPMIVHTDEDGLRCVKRSQCEVPALLREARDGGGVSEVWLWNTCNRFEFYGWLSAADDDAARAATVDRLRKLLFPERQTDGMVVNVLRGGEAWHHLLRTAAGLNSRLPGEREILDQLDAAHRLAARAETTGPRAKTILAEIQRIEREMRTETGWQRFDADYCFASLSHVARESGIDFAKGQTVVIGGSTTSLGVLRTLTKRFGAASELLTLLYRGHKKGGQIKLLRKALQHGKRIRVQSYEEAQVERAIADADVVIFGTDTREPTLHGDRLDQLRDFRKRPLTIIDFNTFGATIGINNADGVRLYPAEELAAYVARFADNLCSDSQFRTAAAAAELWLSQYVRTGSAGVHDDSDGRVMAGSVSRRVRVVGAPCDAPDAKASVGDIALGAAMETTIAEGETP